MSARTFRLAFVALALPLLGAAAGTVTINAPADTVRFKPGPGVNLAVANCMTCHSAAYIYTQPRLTRAQWTGEVTKMKAAYGAPIDAATIPGIVDYLMTQDGKE